ncbi:uncharacterized protein LOC135393087 [Ornithodoros turicata]|uniref:uncharacterized protein LOC135393087 n=1 Tax=Ornithodoros turicata TaxID=34597 RepID=UPI003139F863
MVEFLTETVACLVQRLPPLPAQELDVESDVYVTDREEDLHPPIISPHSPHDPDVAGEGSMPAVDDWLTGFAGVGHREVSPAIIGFVRGHWGPDGRSERCRKALADFPRLKLPFLVVPDLNPEVKVLALEAARQRRRPGDSEPDCGSVRQRDQALRDGQAAIVSAVSPLVALLEHCSEESSTAPGDPPSGMPHGQGRVDRRVVADHLAAALSHLGRLFTSLGNERRESVLNRVAPDLRSLVTRDHLDEEGAAQLFGQQFLDQIRMRNETYKVLREARQGTQRGSPRNLL